MIRFEKMRISGAELGECNPLPDIMNNTYIHARYTLSPSITREEGRYIGWGMLPTLLPYLAQDGYTRERKDMELPSVVLENKYLRAVFLPSLGGRLWQLYDKVAGRDLLYVNPVFQPCNLALRNAWFSGGVEFNLGIRGHSPFTCAGMFALRREDEAGNEVLSMYEYERIRGVAYSVNAWLPEDSRVLYIRDVIENTAPTDTAMYWWSNIAVPETEKTRVLVPADRAFICHYQEDSYLLDKTPIPHSGGSDVSYPAGIGDAQDFFFQIPQEESKWIAAVEGDGRGLLHFSESRLKGRKLFLWGKGSGGRHWGEFLAGAEPHSGEAYIEIQAGLAHTQLEHFPMEGGSEIAFTECYGPLEADPAVLHGSWDGALGAVNRELLRCTGGKTPDEFLKDRFPDVANMKTTEVFLRGSGWGKLENRVRDLKGAAPVSRYFEDWEAPRCGETAPWQELLDTGCFQAAARPVSYIIDRPWAPDFWEQRLAQACQAEPENGTAWMQYGVTLYAKGKKQEAEKAWGRAAALGCPWGWRNLAAYHANELGDYKTAAEEILTAAAMLPRERSVAVDCGSILWGSGDPALIRRFLALQEGFAEEVRNHPRVRLLCVRAYLALNEPEQAMEILTPDFEMPDIKEGELSASALWLQMHTQYLQKTEKLSLPEAEEAAKIRYPLPYALDFRMKE